jgi:hypothetical protein
MKTTVVVSDVRYNVHCVACGAVWQPQSNSPLWWQAKRRAEKGFLDALHVDAEKCGCVTPRARSEAPFRVFGFDDMCRDFDVPFATFTAAVKGFIDANRYGCTVFIGGVSKKVERKLALMF